MHGYEVMNVLEERWHGFYRPSPGAIYPALRALLRKGYVAVRSGERRKTYRVTRQGTAYLRRRAREFEARVRAFEETIGPERAGLIRELRATGKLLAANMRDLTPTQARELAALVVKLRERAVRVLARSREDG